MLRLKYKALSEISDRYYYENEIFTGVAFDVVDCMIERKLEISNGVICGEYNSMIRPLEFIKAEVDFSCLTQEEVDVDQPYFFKGKRYSGGAYEFIGDNCVTEFIFEDGWLTNESSFSCTGELEGLQIVDGNLSQKYKWTDSGRITYFEIVEANSFGCSIVFEESGEVNTISIDGNYFERIKTLGDKVKYHLFDNRDFAKEFSGASYVYVSGTAVDGKIFEGLIANYGLSNTSKLRICRTPLKTSSLEKLIPIQNITELYVESKVLTLEDIKYFKSQRPECFVEFNRKEVTV